MERDINTWQRDGGKAPLQNNVAVLLLLLLGGCETTLDNLSKHFLDLVDSKLLQQLQNVSIHRQGVHHVAYFSEVNFLDLQVIENIGHCLQGYQLSGTHVLLALEQTAW